MELMPYALPWKIRSSHGRLVYPGLYSAIARRQPYFQGDAWNSDSRILVQLLVFLF